MRAASISAVSAGEGGVMGAIGAIGVIGVGGAGGTGRSGSFWSSDGMVAPSTCFGAASRQNKHRRAKLLSTSAVRFFDVGASYFGK